MSNKQVTSPQARLYTEPEQLTMAVERHGRTFQVFVPKFREQLEELTKRPDYLNFEPKTVGLRTLVTTLGEWLDNHVDCGASESFWRDVFEKQMEVISGFTSGERFTKVPRFGISFCWKLKLMHNVNVQHRVTFTAVNETVTIRAEVGGRTSYIPITRIDHVPMFLIHPLKMEVE